MRASASNTQHQILKATTITGGASVLNIFFRILQSKAIALLAGPTGVGLLGLYNSTTSLAATVSGMGLGTSGVRQIVGAAAHQDPIHLAKTVVVYRRTTLLFAVTGALIFFVLRQPIAQTTFGSSDYADAVGLLAAIPLFTLVASAQGALLRGMRHVGELATAGVVGMALGTITGLPLLFLWGSGGIAPYLLTVAIVNSIISWMYARRIRLMPVKVSWQEAVAAARPLLALGLIFMVSGMTTVATLYLVRVLITRELGLDATGLFEASSALSNVYVGFILGAMGADFFPHLTSVAHDPTRSTELINHQVEIGLLLATPGLLAVLVLGPWLLQLLYSADFVVAFDILRWQVLGTFLRVATWPLGFLLLAKGQSGRFFWSEFSTNMVYLGSAWLGLQAWGITGVGIALLLMYLYYMLIMTLQAYWLVGFQWSQVNLRHLAGALAVISIGFSLTLFSSSALSIVAGVILTLGVTVYSLKLLYQTAGPATIKLHVLRLKARFGWSQG